MPKTPSPSNEEPSDPRFLLADYHRWSRRSKAMAVLIAGLGVTLVLLWSMHPSLKKVEEWERLSLWWVSGVSVSVGLGFGLWLFCRHSLTRTARHLDANLSAMNRLETYATHQSAVDPLTQAQREETLRFLKRVSARPRTHWLKAMTFVLGAIIVAHFVTLGVWVAPRSSSHEAVTQQKPEPTPSPVAPKASIAWRSPVAETKAASIEEVPLDAVATSTSGLRDLILEIAVNGEPRMSVPISIDVLSKPGKHSIQTSLYVDQLGVEPYDMISYHLRASRIYADPLPETASPVQFVQVRPFREDVIEVAGGGSGKPNFSLAAALKVAQLRLFKENFLLVHADIGKDHPTWKKENDRVRKEQAVLEEKTGEVIEVLTKNGTHPAIVDLMIQARPWMKQASESIGKRENKAALALQGKALGAITEVEKYLKRLMAKGGSAKPGPKVKDPFEKQKELELKQRFETQAGELELLAREQRRLAEDLAKAKTMDAASGRNGRPMLEGIEEGKPEMNRIEGSFSERQTKLSQRIAALVNGQAFMPQVTEHLEKGHQEAKESLRHLDAEDVVQSRGPAASAAKELQLAQAAMQKAGDDQAKEQLSDALRLLNQAGREVAKAPQEGSEQEAKEAVERAAEKLEQARMKVAEGSMEQQETGSAKAASRLAAVASKLNDVQLREELQKLHNQPFDEAKAKAVSERLAQTADQVAGNADRDKKKSQEVANLIERVERSRANMLRLIAQEERQSQSQSRGATLMERPGSEETREGGKEGEGKQGEGKEGQTGDAGQGKTVESSQGRSGDSLEGQMAGSAEGEGRSSIGEGEGMPEETQTQSPEGAGTSQDGNPGSQPLRGGGGHGGLPMSGAGAPTSSEEREHFAREVIEDIQQQVADATIVLPNYENLNEMKIVLRKGATGRGFAHIVVTFKEIQGPLAQLITMLKSELETSQRQFRLSDQGAEKAPHGYREAVADYFEKLSLDYNVNSEKEQPEQ